MPEGRLQSGTVLPLRLEPDHRTGTERTVGKEKEMTSIIYGFIISGFFILSGCYIRLGLILRELEKKNEKTDI